ncbi:hypothetical protein DICPUDRAFT_157035 [Dictyostelium purpureum]|uniref:DUF676 domain-containing protein n=1 Tax=Dictyostelium purpureum TaxID=5786 RepID=F0ZY37_DICPU|nr:uncharacterized protein DICPUDRAFT_157035 [Dictyostelium purpureum]EGC31146.1 hypothetical protein DICPUDRAFT_157035 [Dictyostelium purpureum]|eukprot:XP_003292334.1 hypothetical protein DICPUDRAFT_157035 [Dictyostelium purpureum]
MDNNNNTTTTSTSSSPNIEEKKKINHLVVLQHGLHGTFEDFNTIKNHFIKQNYDNCVFISAKSNSYFLATHDGINKIGTRLYKEVLELYEQYDHPEKISMIGHSLGGLITRYAIGLLYRDGFFERCKPDQFISLSSPHCGSRRPSTTVFNKIAHVFVDNLLSVTGKQLILNDLHSLESDSPKTTTVSPTAAETTATSTTTETGSPTITIIEKKEENEIITNDQSVPLPLLVRMTEGIFFEGLKQFRKRVLYSNIYNDIQVNFCTSDISAKNPYTLGKTMKFTEKYKHVIEEETILDIDPEVLEKLEEDEDSNEGYKESNTKQTTKKPHYHHDDSKIDEFFTHDTHHLHLKRILKNLRKLDFVRYHMYFKNFLSHTNIVVKRESINGEGWDIVDHLVDHFEP